MASILRPLGTALMGASIIVDALAFCRAVGLTTVGNPWLLLVVGFVTYGAGSLLRRRSVQA